MKKILFAIPTFKTGGFCTSLLSFLNLYDKNLFDVDVLVLTHQGTMKSLFDGYNILPENLFLSSSAYNNHREEKLFKRYFIILIKLIKRVLAIINQEWEWKICSSRYKGYDAVVAFAEGSVTHFVSYIPCDNKIAWVHCNVTYAITSNKDKERYAQIYKTFNKIVCVANYVKSVFVDMFPFAADTTISIYNLSQTDVILKRSVELIPKEMESPLFTIISLGKFSYVKQYSKIPDIAKKVAESGFKFKWYVLGGIINQDEYDLFMTRIRDYGLEEYVVSLGEKKNPYPYLAHSDLLVCTSESEACPMIFIEAKALHIPICTTDFGSAPEFVDDGINGNIAPIESLDEKIVKLIEDKSYYEVVKKNVSCFVYDNNTILEKIYSII